MEAQRAAFAREQEQKVEICFLMILAVTRRDGESHA